MEADLKCVPRSRFVWIAGKGLYLTSDHVGCLSRSKHGRASDDDQGRQTSGVDAPVFDENFIVTSHIR